MQSSPLESAHKDIYSFISLFKIDLSYDVASESEITPYNIVDEPLVVYRILGEVMMSITTFRT